MIKQNCQNVLPETFFILARSCHWLGSVRFTYIGYAGPSVLISLNSPPNYIIHVVEQDLFLDKTVHVGYLLFTILP